MVDCLDSPAIPVILEIYVLNYFCLKPLKYLECPEL